MTPAEFVAKWTGVELSERAASQEHFLDLCHLLDQPTPAQADPAGDSFTFEKAVKVVGAASKPFDQFGFLHFRHGKIAPLKFVTRQPIAIHKFWWSCPLGRRNKG